ncbi:hypothetical protein HDU93_005358 [Gonapodya sp. JEL0774]|nr:hypothetical protein HDU93_005358 [Gonapodya sp. JEL0774]
MGRIAAADMLANSIFDRPAGGNLSHQIRTWVLHWEKTGHLPICKHTFHIVSIQKLLILHEEFKLKVVEWLRNTSERIEPQSLRWSRKTQRFVDGHEQADVIDYQQNSYLPRWAELEQDLPHYADGDQKEMETIEWSPQPGVVVYDAVFHDESTCYSADDGDFAWANPELSRKMQSKTKGSSIMILEYISERFGRVKLTPERIEKLRDKGIEVLEKFISHPAATVVFEA